MKHRHSSDYVSWWWTRLGDGPALVSDIDWYLWLHSIMTYSQIIIGVDVRGCPCFIARKQPNMSESILHLQINFGPSRSGTKHKLSLWYKDRVYITLFWYKDFENYVSMAIKYYVNICMFVSTYLNLSTDINWDCLVNFWKQLMNMTIFNLFSSVF